MAGSYKNALLSHLGQEDEAQDDLGGQRLENTGVAGGRSPVLDQPMGAGTPTGGDAMQARASWDTTGMTPDQRSRFTQDTNAALARDAAGNQADMDFLNANGGQWGTRQQYRPGAMPNIGDYGGVSEGGIGFDTPPTATAAAAPAASDFSRLNAGYSRDKLNDKNKMSAKYQMGRALSGLDPTKGFTPDAVAALNALGFGNFSAKTGSDKLSLSGLTDKGRAAGLTGDYTDADFIEALKSGNGKWGYADPAAEALSGGGGPAMAAAGGHGGGAPIGGALLDSALSGDPLARVQQLIAQMSGSRPNVAALMQQLGGG